MLDVDGGHRKKPAPCEKHTSTTSCTGKIMINSTFRFSTWYTRYLTTADVIAFRGVSYIPSPANSDGQLRHLRAHPGRAAVRHRLSGHPRAGAQLAMAACQRHVDRALAGPRALEEPVHGPQAARDADNCVVPAGVHRVHAPVSDDRVDVDARAGPTLSG